MSCSSELEQGIAIELLPSRSTRPSSPIPELTDNPSKNIQVTGLRQAEADDVSTSFTQLLRRRPAFRLLWVSSCISLLGDHFCWVGLVALVTRLGHSDLLVSAMLINECLPIMLFSGVAGVAADRFSRSGIMISCNLVAALAMGGLFVADQIGSLPLTFGAAAILFICQAFCIPAEEALFPTLVHRDEVQLSNALDGVSFSVLLAVGAAVGGLFTSFFGIPATFLVNAVTFLLSAAGLAILHQRVTAPGYEPLHAGDEGDYIDDSTDAETDVPGSMYQMYASGLRYIKARPDLMALAVFRSVSCVALAAVEVLCIRLTTETFTVHLGSSDSNFSLGFMWSMIGVGCLIGNRLTLFVKDKDPVHLRQGIMCGYALSCLGALMLATSINAAMFFTSVPILFAGDAIVYVLTQTAVVKGSTDAYRGRVFSFFLAARTTSYSAGYLLSGVAFDYSHIAVQHAFLPFVAMMVCNVVVIQVWYIPYTRHNSEACLEETHVATDSGDDVSTDLSVIYSAVNVTVLSDNRETKFQRIPPSV